MTLPEDAQASESGQKSVFSHVVFATDWSPASEKAMGYILNFKDIITELEIVHVIDKRLDVKDMRDLKEKLVQTRKIFLEKGIDAEPHIYAGRRPEEIMLAAKDYGATCIVMGTTGKSTLKDLLSRSCSYRVSEASVVPTLVVP
jgi:nucleotide-binding universal stress UspA family protein